MSLSRLLLRRLRAYRDDTRAVAMIEFAFSLPLLILVVYGGIEMGRFLLLNQKIERVSATIVNILAQSTAYNPSEVDLILGNANSFILPFRLQENGAVIVTHVLRNAADKKVITWQKRTGLTSITSQIGPAPAGGTCPQANNLPTEIPSESGSEALIVESVFNYTPLIDFQFPGINFSPAKTIRFRTVHTPRYGNMNYDTTQPNPCPTSIP